MLLEQTAIQAITEKYHEKDVAIFLSNGVRLSGNISDVGVDFIYLLRDMKKQLVMKQSISTIMPDQASFDGNDDIYNK